MKNYKSMFLALFITLQSISFASLPKISKHWNNGFSKKRSRVYKENFKENSHVW